MTAKIVPFHTFLWKVASRCNLNCSYCFVYNLADQTWRNKPASMSLDVARCTAIRMREHLQQHNKKYASIVFHGGEPFLLDTTLLENYVQIIRDELTAHGIEINLGVQTNATLLSDSACSWIERNEVQVGVSIDGPPHINDIYRLDHKGRGSSSSVEVGLKNLVELSNARFFSGFLTVVNIEVDPIEIVDYLCSWNPARIDFLLPLANHSAPPAGKEECRDSTVYGEWLTTVFNHVLTLPKSPQVRRLDSIVRLLLGRDSLLESVGLGAVDLVVVESDGSIEAVDSLKSTFNGATDLGLNVRTDNFEAALQHDGIRLRHVGANSLCKQCRECNLVQICGGDYLPHRYSHENGFQNPSIYCSDMKMIIGHVAERVGAELHVHR